MKVKLKQETIYKSSQDNPKIGSVYECEGLIISNYDYYESMGIESTCKVLWDNGRRNSYTKEDLIYLNEKAKFKSIW